MFVDECILDSAEKKMERRCGERTRIEKTEDTVTFLFVFNDIFNS